MRFLPASLPGAFVIEPERLEDERGFFATLWTPEEFRKHGLDPSVDSGSVAFNLARGTLRGMHYQIAPHEETKLVRCTMGAIHDVLVDLRPASAAFRKWFATELSAENRKMLYVPRGVAHGYLTLADRSEISYQIGGRYTPAAGRGVRWDDPAFGIEWPDRPRVINERDAHYPDFRP